METPVLSLLALLLQMVLRLVPEMAERARGVETQVHPLVLPSTQFTYFTSTKGARAPYLSKGDPQRVYCACTQFTCFTSTKGAHAPYLSKRGHQRLYRARRADDGDDVARVVVCEVNSIRQHTSAYVSIR